ncbi:hypothetical protein OAR19_00615 [bacterium]|nr:hypothetical protein [bacterium]
MFLLTKYIQMVKCFWGNPILGYNSTEIPKFEKVSPRYLLKFPFITQLTSYQSKGIEFTNLFLIDNGLDMIIYFPQGCSIDKHAYIYSKKTKVSANAENIIFHLLQGKISGKVKILFVEADSPGSTLEEINFKNNTLSIAKPGEYAFALPPGLQPNKKYIIQVIFIATSSQAANILHDTCFRIYFKRKKPHKKIVLKNYIEHKHGDWRGRENIRLPEVLKFEGFKNRLRIASNFRLFPFADGKRRQIINFSSDPIRCYDFDGIEKNYFGIDYLNEGIIHISSELPIYEMGTYIKLQPDLFVPEWANFIIFQLISGDFPNIKLSTLFRKKKQYFWPEKPIHDSNAEEYIISPDNIGEYRFKLPKSAIGKAHPKMHLHFTKDGLQEDMLNSGIPAFNGSMTPSFFPILKGSSFRLYFEE